jgi:alkanesulfonate monooxygenase SsuD/methylene tetrahydromethanopterin reductase-like flavin-dependent oxidoreductase (luciferase family)
VRTSWSAIAAIAATTERLRLGTGVAGSYTLRAAPPPILVAAAGPAAADLAGEDRRRLRRHGAERRS